MPHKPRLRQVMLLVETSRAYGRGLVEGIGRYVEEHGPWSIYFEERGLLDPLPKWLKNWRGDGIISRTVRKADIERLRATHLPVVELYADPILALPRVYPDQNAIARLAAEHFLDRGFRRFAFFCTDRAWYMKERRDTFVAELQRRGFSCECFPAHGDRDLASRVQMERAKLLLCETDMPVETVCQRSGFVSFKYFARAFHRVAGMTPRSYRKAHGTPAATSRNTPSDQVAVSPGRLGIATH